MDNTITMESTTDSPEQIREGLGLPADTPPAVVDPVAVAEAAIDAAISAARPTSTDAAAVPPAEAASAAIVPVADPVPTLESIQAELAAANARLAALTAAPPVTPAAEPRTAAAPLDVVKDPAITAVFKAKREALGARPTLDRFDGDYDKLEEAKDEWVAARATLTVQEEMAQEQSAIGQRQRQQHVAKMWEAQGQKIESSVATAKARHADYESLRKLAENPNTHPCHPGVKAAIENADDPGELQYFLFTHPDKLKWLHEAHGPTPEVASQDLGRRIGMLEYQVTQGLSASRATAHTGAIAAGPATAVAPRVAGAPPLAAAIARPVGHAPDPQGTSLGNGTARMGSLDLEEPNISTKEYNRRKALKGMKQN